MEDVSSECLQTIDDLFGRCDGLVPRPEQREADRFLRERYFREKSLVLEGPTGVGKTHIGILFATYMDGASAWYAAGTMDQQIQVYEECKRLGISAGIIFGRDNYVCHEKAKKLVAESVPAFENNFSVHPVETVRNAWYNLHGAGVVPEATLNTECASVVSWIQKEVESMESLETDLSVPQRKRFNEMVHSSCMEKTRSYWNAFFEKCLCDHDCKCAAKTGSCKCPRKRAQQQAKNAQVLVVNFAYLMMLANFDMLQHTLQAKPLVIDEAHLLVSYSEESLFRPQSPPPLCLRTLENEVAEWSQESALIKYFFSGGIPRGGADLFEKACRNHGGYDHEWYADEKNFRFGPHFERIQQYVQEFYKCTLQDTESEEEDRLLKSFEEDTRSLLEWVEEAACDDTDDKIARGMILQHVTSYVKDINRQTWMTLTYKEPREALFDDMNHDEFWSREHALEDAIARMEGVLTRAWAKASLSSSSTHFWKCVVEKSLKSALPTVADVRGAIRYLKNLQTSIKLSHDAITSWDNATHDSRPCKKDFCPVVHRDGIRFDMLPQKRAETLDRCLWSRLQAPVLCMSATISSSGQVPFKMFRTEIGLRGDCDLALRTPFDLGKIEIRLPRPMNTSGCSFSGVKRTISHVHENAYFARMIAEYAIDSSKRYHKATIVTGPNKNDLRTYYDFFREHASSLCLHGWTFVYQPTTPSAIEAFKNEKMKAPCEAKNRYILFGSQTLFTGFDAPNRIGLVVILKRMKPKWDASTRYIKDRLEENLWREEEDWRLEHERRSFLQAVGRIMRHKDDNGGTVLMFHDNNPNKSFKREVDFLSERYDDLTTPGFCA